MIAYTLQFGLGSCLLVLFLRKKIAWDRALAASILIVAIFAGAALVVFSAQQNASIGSLVNQYVQEETERAMEPVPAGRDGGGAVA